MSTHAVDDDDSFASPRPAASQSNAAMTPAEREADMDRIAASPLLQPPGPSDAQVLRASVRASRELASERASLRAALAAHKAEDQSARIAAQEAEMSPEDEEAEAESRRHRRPDSSGGQGRFPPLPALSDIQRELLAQVEQQEPPPRVASFVPLPERLEKWLEENQDLTPAELDERLISLATLYKDTRPRATRDAKRMWTTNQHLHELSMKLASITKLDDFDRLSAELKEAKMKQQQGGLVDPSAAALVDLSTYFYDLHTLDLDSYADIRHMHRACIVDSALQRGAGAGASGESTARTSSGWWRTQLSELDEDFGERRRRDRAVLAEIERGGDEHEQGYRPADNPDAIDEARRGAAENFDRLNGRRKEHADSEERPEGGLLLARNFRANEAELEADLLAGADGRSPGPRETRAQLLARNQGRTYVSSTGAREVALPEGQRILRDSNEQLQGHSQRRSRAHQHASTRGDEDLDAALEAAASGVNKPARRNG